jgi:quercetin dioxygenase-like cupin family protein
MSHPNPKGPPDHTPIQTGDIWENPVNRERLTILERPWDNPEGRATFEMTALVGARVVGEHRHPAIIERFTVIEGELTVKRNGQTGILRQTETAVAEAGVWHDWWNAQGHAMSLAAGPDRPRVQRRGRVPFTASGGAAHCLWGARARRVVARLSRDLPAILTQCAGAPDLGPGSSTAPGCSCETSIIPNVWCSRCDKYQS